MAKLKYVGTSEPLEKDWGKICPVLEAEVAHEIGEVTSIVYRGIADKTMVDLLRIMFEGHDIFEKDDTGFIPSEGEIYATPNLSGAIFLALRNNQLTSYSDGSERHRACEHWRIGHKELILRDESLTPSEKLRQIREDREKPLITREQCSGVPRYCAVLCYDLNRLEPTGFEKYKVKDRRALLGVLYFSIHPKFGDSKPSPK